MRTGRPFRAIGPGPIAETSHLPIAGGKASLEEDTVAEQDTFTANGKTLTSDWYHFRVGGTYDSDLTEITTEFSSGQVMRIVLPDGTAFKSAGLYRFVPLHPDVYMSITPDRGLSGDVDVFCAALS